MFKRIGSAIHKYRRRTIPAEGYTPAAVLVPLFMIDDQVHLLMQQRSELVEKHKGQVSFPGGMSDPGDRDAIHTALRETEEEVGLPADQVEVLGLLDDLPTISGFLVTPVVGRVPDVFDYRASPAEVEELLKVPLHLFRDGSGKKERSLLEHDGQQFEVDFYPFGGRQIWGATARIANNLVSVLDNGGKPQE